MNEWNQRYAIDDYFYGQEPNDFLREQAHLLAPGMKVLCLAEGEGRNAVFLATLGLEVVAMDGSDVGLAKLKKLALSRKVTVETIQANLETFIIEEGSWDAIISIWCHVPSELRKNLHKRCARGLKSGGYFILEAYRPEQIALGTGGPKNRDFLPTLDDLKTELSGLKLLLAKNIEREIQEGQGHRGLSAVVQIVAQKAID